MHGNLLNKNKLKLFNTANSDLAARILILENNVYKVTYYEIISGASGTLTVPTAATINANEFSGANCILSEIDINNKPTWVSPKTAGGTVVTATLNTGTGAWVKSGVTVSANVALIYSINIAAKDYSNLTNFYIIDETVIGDFSYVLNNTTTGTVSSSLLANAMSDETGTGALVFGTSPTFTTDITINGSQTTNIGTGKMSILAFSGTQVAMYMNNTAAAGTTNYAVLTTNSTATFNGRTNMSLAAGGTSYLNLNPSANSIMWAFSNANKTGNTASTELNQFKVTGSSLTWDNGGGATTIATQRWNYFTANTAATSGGGSLTISESIGLDVEAASASGVTITNNFAARFTAGTATIKIGNWTGSTTDAAIYINQSTPSTSNYTLYGTSSTTQLNCASGGSLYLTYSGASLFAATNAGAAFTFSPRVAGAGAVNSFIYSASSNTGQTASTEISGYLYNSYTRTWATGNITTQREQYIKTVTYAFAAASTITNSYGLYVEAPTAGTNATITNNWALGTNGNIWINSSSASIYLGNITPSSSNYALSYTAANEVSVNAPTTGRIRAGGTISATWSATDFNVNGTGGLSIVNNANDTKVSWTRTGGNSYSLQHTTNRFYFYNVTTTSEFASFYNTNQINFGNYASPTNLRLFTVGQDTAYASFGSLVGTTSVFAIYVNQASPSASNYAFKADSSVTYLNGNNQLAFMSANALQLSINRTANAIVYDFTPSAISGLTASTENSTFKVTGNTKTWSAGAITTQRWNYFTANTAAFASASTISESIALAVEAATAGTNATITNNFALGLTAGTATLKFGNLTGSTSESAIYMNAATPSATNFILNSNGVDVQLNAPSISSSGSIFLRVQGSTRYTITNNTHAWAGAATTTGATTNFTFTKPNNTGQTADVAISGWLFTTGSRTWSTSVNITNQIEIDVTAPSYICVSGTMSNAWTMYLRQPTISGGASIGRSMALGIDGNMSITNNKIIYGVDSAGTYRALLTWSSGDNITFTGRPGTTDIVLNPTSGGIGTYIKGSQQSVGIHVASPGDALSIGNPGARSNIVGIVNSASTNVFNIVNSNGQAQFYGAGLITTPSISFIGATTYGMSYEASQLGFVTNGTVALKFSSAQVATFGSTNQDLVFTPTATAPTLIQTGSVSSLFKTSSGTRNVEIVSYAADTNYLNYAGAALRIYSGGSYSIEFWNAGTRRGYLDSLGNWSLQNGALATNATSGFVYLPSCAGTPTGAPTSLTGGIPIVVDSTNNKVYIYSGGAWVALN